MVSTEFIAKWHGTPLTEQAGAQTYFNDLCDMLGVDKPNDPETYCFERGAARTGASHGWADVWKRGFFAWVRIPRNLDTHSRRSWTPIPGKR